LSLASQFQRLSKQASAFRQDLFGSRDDTGAPILLDYDNGTEVEGYFSPVRTQEQLDAAGFKDIHDTIVRISKANLETAAIGKTIGLPWPDGTTKTVRISEFGNHGVGTEWVLGCKNEF
jgi:hypothetical protein